MAEQADPVDLRKARIDKLFAQAREIIRHVTVRPSEAADSMRDLSGRLDMIEELIE